MRVLLIAGLLAGSTVGSPTERVESGDVEIRVPEAAPAPADTLGGEIVGRIWSTAGTPVAHARIEVMGAARKRAGVSRPGGGYRLTDLAPGSRTIRVSALDHRTTELTVQIPPGATVELDVTLALRPVALPDVLVTEFSRGGAWSPPADSLVRGSPADPRLQAVAAGGALVPDLTGPGRGSPPTDPGEPPSLLWVRGGTSDLRLVLLDGAPVYAPFHLGGLIDATSPGVLASSRLYKGGAPARFDGGLREVLELRSRQGRPDRVEWSGAADVLHVRNRVEGPVGPVTFLAAGRTLHDGISGALTGGPLPYRYGDALVRADVEVGEGSSLTGTGFWNREAVRLAAMDGEDSFARWGNSAGSVRWRRSAENSLSEVTAAVGTFNTRLPEGAVPEGVLGDPAAGEDGMRLVRGRLDADFTRTVGGARVGFGASYERHDVATPGTTGPRRMTGDVAGLYGEVVWSPAPDLETQVGLRGDHFTAEPAFRLAPRVRLGWQASEQSTLTVAAGRYYQYLQAPERLASIGGEGVTDPFRDLRAFSRPGVTAATGSGDSGNLEPLPETLQLATATHLTLGLDHRPRDELRLGMEAFFKSFDLPEPVSLEARTDDGVLGDAPREPLTDLNSSGVDLWMDARGDGWSAWAGYSLAWTWHPEAGRSSTSRFQGRQIVTAGGVAPLPGGLKVEASVAASAGLPFRSVPLQVDDPDVLVPDSGAPASGEASAGSRDVRPPPSPDGSFLRLNARLSRTWSTGLMGTTANLSPYLKLVNALDRRDALFFRFDGEGDLRPQPLDPVPLVPVVGLEWRW